MTNKDILNTAMCQSAADLACEPENFLTHKNKIVISKKMAWLPTSQIGAYLRKMAIDGYIIYTDLSEIKEFQKELQAIGRKINQRQNTVNETGQNVKVYGIIGAVSEQIDAGFIRRTAVEIIDTYTSVLTVYNNTEFSFYRWEKYIDSVLPRLLPTIVRDTKRTLCSGDISEKDLLTVLNHVARSREQVKAAHDSFLQATEMLECVIYEQFGKNLDVSVIFYLGLCNGAGWVTEYRGKTAILLGIEKIIELDWCNIDDMYGLIYHELGHVYQKQYGILRRTFDNDEDSFLWQLFTEGVAMCFEQNLIGDTEYYHQDKNGWETWCDNHFEQIKLDFAHDIKTMSVSNRRYFGDWVSYNGHGDVGYYLGCRFVRYILSMYEFDEIICFDINNVKELFERFKR